MNNNQNPTIDEKPVAPIFVAGDQKPVGPAEQPKPTEAPPPKSDDKK